MEVRLNIIRYNPVFVFYITDRSKAILLLCFMFWCCTVLCCLHLVNVFIFYLKFGNLVVWAANWETAALSVNRDRICSLVISYILYICNI